MPSTQTRLALAALLVAPVLASCGGAVTDEYVVENDPGHVEFLEGSDLGRVTMSQPAADRLGIKTEEVGRDRRGLIVPSSAIFVDTDGQWWVYTNPEPLTFIRHPIKIRRDNAGFARLESGPPAGTDIVTVGVAELYGVEAEVSH
jgi:hypothetical protein